MINEFESGGYSDTFDSYPDTGADGFDTGGYSNVTDSSDPLFSLTSDLDAIIAAITEEATTSRETAELPSFGESGDIKGEANDNKPASTGGDSWISQKIKSIWTAFGGSSDDTPANKNAMAKTMLTGAAYGIAGLGAGYSNAQKLKQERELAQQKLDTDRLLAQSQAGIAQQKMKNMDFSNFNFQKPGLINSQLQYKPVKDPYPRKPS